MTTNVTSSSFSSGWRNSSSAGNDRLQDIFGGLAGMGPNEVFESFFSKHLTPSILRFPDTVSADQNNLTGLNLTLVFLIGRFLRHPQRQGMPGQFIELPAVSIINESRIMTGIDPSDNFIAVVNFTKKQGHKLAGLFNIAGNLSVDIRYDLVQFAGSQSALLQKGPGRGHQ